MTQLALFDGPVPRHVGFPTATLFVEHGIRPAEFYYAGRLLNAGQSRAEVARVVKLSIEQVEWIDGWR